MVRDTGRSKSRGKNGSKSSSKSSRSEGKSDILERGKIYFFYRPKVTKASAKETGKAAAHGMNDVERLYMVLRPQDKKKYRMLVVGAKKMPAIRDGGQKNWAFVDDVTSSPGKIKRDLQAEEYGTKTRGKRLRPQARPAGEGVYRIVRHGDHTHLAYALELPKGQGKVQKALNLKDQGSYIVSVKNPEKGTSRARGLRKDQRAEFPKRLQGKFEGRRFYDMDPPDFLNYEGCEVLFIGAKKDARKELGIELNTRDESAASAKVFKELKVERKKQTKEPLLAGEWA